MLIPRGADLNGSCVDAGDIEDRFMNLGLGARRHAAIGVWHDEHAVDIEQVRGQHQGAQDVIGDTRPCVADDLDVAGVHAEDRQRFDSRIHTGDDCEPLQRFARELLMSEGHGERSIRCENVLKRVVGKSRRFAEVCHEGMLTAFCHNASAGSVPNMSQTQADLAIVGAGPAGLFAAYYAGFRGFSVVVIDALPEVGGQVSAMYPEKEIFDIAGIPAIRGRELVDQLEKQAAPYNPTYCLNTKVVGLVHGTDDVTLTTDHGDTVTAKAVVISGGIGSFTPRQLPTGDEWLGRGMVYFVPSLQDHAGKDVVIVGGGDSAFDWAWSLRDIAKSLTIVHRRDAFRAHATTVDMVREAGVRLIVNAEVAAVSGDEVVRSVTVRSKGDGAEETLPCDTLVAALGFVANIGPITEWGLELDKRHIKVTPSMHTNLERVLACGDICSYEGRVPLIAVGFGEAATAVNNAARLIDPSFGLFPGHSSGGSAE